MSRSARRAQAGPLPSFPQVARCELCGREVPRRLLTQHHLLPRQKGGKVEHKVPFCKTCHNTVHATFTNAQLAKGYASVDRLRSAAELTPYLAWIRRQSPERTFAVHQRRRT